MIQSVKIKHNVINFNLVNFNKQIVYNRLFQIDFDDVCILPKHTTSELGLDIYSWLCFNYAYGIVGYIFKDDNVENGIQDKMGNKYKVYLLNDKEQMADARKALKMKLKPVLVKDADKIKIILE